MMNGHIASAAGGQEPAQQAGQKVMKNCMIT